MSVQSRNKRISISIWKYVLATVLVLGNIVILYVLISMSFKTSAADLANRLTWPAAPGLDNYAVVLKNGKIFTAYKNSIIITIGTVLLEVFLSAFAAYPLARNDTKLSRLISSFCLGVMMIPGVSILVGVYTTLVKMNGINQLWSVIAIGAAFGLPMSIFMFTNFIRTIPVALDEAAIIDGANLAQTFVQIILPQLQPCIVSIVIMKGIQAWNSYLYPSYILQSPESYTVILLIKQNFGANSTNLQGAAACAVLGIAPIIVMYLLLQKYFVRGQIDAAVK